MLLTTNEQEALVGFRRGQNRPLLLLPNVEVASLLDKRAIDRLDVLIWHVDGVIPRQKLLVGQTHGLRLHIQLGLDAGQKTIFQCKSMLVSSY